MMQSTKRIILSDITKERVSLTDLSRYFKSSTEEVFSICNVNVHTPINV